MAEANNEEDSRKITMKVNQEKFRQQRLNKCPNIFGIRIESLGGKKIEKRELHFQFH